MLHGHCIQVFTNIWINIAKKKYNFFPIGLSLRIFQSINNRSTNMAAASL